MVRKYLFTLMIFYLFPSLNVTNSAFIKEIFLLLQLQPQLCSFKVHRKVLHILGKSTVTDKRNVPNPFENVFSSSLLSPSHSSLAGRINLNEMSFLDFFPGYSC